MVLRSRSGQLSMEMLLLLAGSVVIALVVGSYVASSGSSLYSKIKSTTFDDVLTPAPSTGGGSSGGTTTNVIDLAAQISVSNTSVPSGSSITVTLSACNRGTVSTSGELRFVADGSAVTSWTLSPINPGTCVSRSTTYTVSAGAHTLSAVVIAAGDSNSANDAASVTVNGAVSVTYVDPYVANLSYYPANPAPGSTLRSDVNVCNDASVTLDFNVVTSLSCGGSVDTNYVTVSIPATTCSIVSVLHSVPSTATGTCDLNATMYLLTGGYADTNTQNNTESTSVTISSTNIVVLFCGNCSSCNDAIQRAKSLAGPGKLVFVRLTSDIQYTNSTASSHACLDFSNVSPEGTIIFDGSGHTITNKATSGYPLIVFYKSKNVVISDLNLVEAQPSSAVIPTVQMISSSDLNFTRVSFSGTPQNVGVVVASDSKDIYFDSCLADLNVNPGYAAFSLLSSGVSVIRGEFNFTCGSCSYNDTHPTLFDGSVDTNISFDGARVNLADWTFAVRGGNVYSSNSSFVANSALLFDVSTLSLTSSDVSVSLDTVYDEIRSTELNVSDSNIVGGDLNVSQNVAFLDSNVSSTLIARSPSSTDVYTIFVTRSKVSRILAVYHNVDIHQSNIQGLYVARGDVNISDSNLFGSSFVQFIGGRDSTTGSLKNTLTMARVRFSPAVPEDAVLRVSAAAELNMENVYFSIPDANYAIYATNVARANLSHVFITGTLDEYSIRFARVSTSSPMYVVGKDLNISVTGSGILLSGYNLSMINSRVSSTSKGIYLSNNSELRLTDSNISAGSSAIFALVSDINAVRSSIVGSPAISAAYGGPASDRHNYLLAEDSNISGEVSVYGYKDFHVLNSRILYAGSDSCAISIDVTESTLFLNSEINVSSNTTPICYNSGSSGDAVTLGSGTRIINSGVFYTIQQKASSPIYLDVSNGDIHICASRIPGILYRGSCTGCDSGHKVYWYGGSGTPFGYTYSCPCEVEVSSFDACVNG